MEALIRSLGRDAAPAHDALRRRPRRAHRRLVRRRPLAEPINTPARRYERHQQSAAAD